MPVDFEGAEEIKKPPNMTDEQCTSVWAKFGLTTLDKIRKDQGGIYVPPGFYSLIDSEGFRFFITAWKPSLEDLNSLNNGDPIYIKTIAHGLPPMAVFTLDEEGNGNF